MKLQIHALSAHLYIMVVETSVPNPQMQEHLEQAIISRKMVVEKMTLTIQTLLQEGIGGKDHCITKASLKW